MRIAIRVDASRQLGIGHSMRCLTLADALQQRGAQIRFVSRHMPEHVKAMLSANGHEFMLLGSSTSEETADRLAHAEWLGTSQYADSQDTIQALRDQIWDWLIVDHYALSARWESGLRKAAKNILVIDDIADRQHDCDALLDQNFYADMDTRDFGKVPLHCRMFLGPRYALLRDEFRQMRKQTRPRSGQVKRVLVFFGGVDLDNCTARAIEGLASVGGNGLHVDVVIGAQHPNCEQIKLACAYHAFDCHVETDRMAELMAGADLAIGGVGSATWERCSVGLPSIVLVMADNQRKSAVDLNAAGVLVNLGEARQITVTALADEVAGLMADEATRTAMSKASLELVTPAAQGGVAEYLMGQKNASS